MILQLVWESLEPVTKFVKGASHWHFFIFVGMVLVFWRAQARKGEALHQKRVPVGEEMPITPSKTAPDCLGVLPDGCQRSTDGNAVLWSERPGWRVTLGTFMVGLFLSAILLTIDLGRNADPFSLHFSYVMFPLLQSPLDPGAYVVAFFHSWPVLCFALTVWCIGLETSVRMSRNRLERRHSWFRCWSRSKIFRDGMIVIDALTTDTVLPRQNVWQWDLEVHSGSRWEVLFGDSSLHSFLKLEKPEALAAEISRITGWPAATRTRLMNRPAS